MTDTKKKVAPAAAKQPGGKTPAAKPHAASEVELEVVTKLERRVRAGVVVTRVPQVVRVSESAAAALEADPHVKVTRK
ncbi:MAG: hypothetical protein LAT63_16910 [Marinobacter sp.]|nr:hypothetical protein [Marinobacter sp.]